MTPKKVATNGACGERRSAGSWDYLHSPSVLRMPRQLDGAISCHG